MFWIGLVIGFVACFVAWPFLATFAINYFDRFERNPGPGTTRKRK